MREPSPSIDIAVIDFNGMSPMEPLKDFTHGGRLGS